ncbi:hypothetical protein [Salinimicrobium terrae]|uniref:hypothetical protein n=1 Tax=Salinimicrobium terrae TaxID=470866 RepID=UPI000402FF3C|nr:hypothetical protein [Salinimicrobium terrae]
MKVNSDFVWAVILLIVAAASFFLGIKKENLKSEELLDEKLEEIRVLENKNQQLSEELISRGIYSYPQASIIPKMEDSVAMVLISLNGKDPIKNLRLRRNVFFNYSAMGSFQPSQEGRLTDLGDLKPHNPSAFDIPLQGDEVALNLEYESKNDTWQQYIWIKKSGEGQIKLFWIITNESSVVIDKHVDPGFHLDSEEKVVPWDDQKINYSNIEMNSIFPPNN